MPLHRRRRSATGASTGGVEAFLHGAAKAGAVRCYADAHSVDLAHSSAYTDSRSDIQLLQAVGHPIAVNPDRALQKAARAQGWPILHFASSKLTLAEAEAALLLDLESAF